MDSTSTTLFKLAISLLLINVDITAGQGTGCSEPPPKRLTDRARQAQTIVYGSVTGIFQGAQPSEYNVEMNIKCVLKGNVPVARVNITEVATDCVDSGMHKGVNYIVFLQVLRDGRGQSRYVTHDLNQQRAANRATKENFAAVRQSGVANQCNTAVYAPPAPKVPFGAGYNDTFGDNGGGGGNRRNAASTLFASYFCLFIASLYSLTLTF